MVTFEEFWSRLKAEFSNAASPKPGVHAFPIKKWSQYSGEMPGKFTVIYEGGNAVSCDTEKTNNWRNIPQSEFRKVYEVWQDYRAGRKNRKFIMHGLGVENGTWVIPILYRYEHLMK